jgi:glucose/mannose-6-phosphate isomerase
VASGGSILEIARRDELPFFELPSVPQGRYGVLYGVRAWAQLMDTLNLTSGLVVELVHSGHSVAVDASEWLPSVPTKDNVAKQIASDVLGRGIVIYGGLSLAAVAMKWKVDFNENSKNLAFWNVLPEMNHNELSGWTKPQDHGMKVIELLSDLDNPQVIKRFEVMNSLLSNRFAPITIDVKGDTRSEQMVWAFMLGSYASAYLGILNQTDIGALPLVSKLKQRLN